MSVDRYKHAPTIEAEAAPDELQNEDLMPAFQFPSLMDKIDASFSPAGGESSSLSVSATA